MGLRTGKPTGRPPQAKQRVERGFGMPLRAILQELYVDRNLSSKAVAMALGVTMGTVVAWVEDSGLPVRPRGGFVQFPDGVKREMAAMYAEGLSLDAVAERFACARHTVGRAVQENRGRVRTRREAARRKYQIRHDYFNLIDTPMKVQNLGLAARRLSSFLWKTGGDAPRTT